MNPEEDITFSRSSMMKTSMLSGFGDPAERVRRALRDLQLGLGVLLVDDENRENEGDLIFPAETITVAQMATLIRECSGIVCLCLTDEKIDSLGLPPMAAVNTNPHGTAFTVSIEASRGVTTGVSAADRVCTVRTAVSDRCGPGDLCRPGHVFPLRSSPGGVLSRRGHTEGTVDLMTLAGLRPAGVLCELTNPDGTMARFPEVVDFAVKRDMTVCSVDDIVRYRKEIGKG
jgi:3,4-dihydroxy 2-butanone 4-phosphate synthase